MLESTGILSRARAEDRKLRKELILEVLALKVPFGSLLSVSESSPVAGAIEGSHPSRYIRCRTRTRVAEKRPASHTNALGELFIPEECGFVQQKVYRGNGFTVLVRKIGAVGIALRTAEPESSGVPI